MRQIIYADIVFLLNFCMNFLALFATGKILALKLRTLKLILSAALGAIYSIFTLFFETAVIPVIILNIAISVLMCLIAFNAETFVKFIKSFIIFYAACFMLGGGIEALFHLFSLSGFNEASNVPTVQIILVLAGICTLIFIFVGRIFKHKTNIKEVQLTIGFGGREAKVNALLDSGNLLRDPVSSLPVIIINSKTAAALFDFKTLSFFTSDTLSYISRISSEIDSEEMEMIKDLKFKIIPVKSIAGASSLFPAFVPEYIRYEKNKKTIEINAVIAVDSVQKTAENSQKKHEKYYGEIYSGIVPSVLID